MNQERYEFEADPISAVYEFVSVGIKGSVKKLVIFTTIEPPDIYNLAFVDIDPQTGEQSDLITTNNGDSQKVLATVAATVLDFTDSYPNALIYATGSTPARTRLYRMGIANNLNEIKGKFEVLGYANDQWSQFQKGVDYQAFLVKRK